MVETTVGMKSIASGDPIGALNTFMYNNGISSGGINMPEIFTAGANQFQDRIHHGWINGHTAEADQGTIKQIADVLGQFRIFGKRFMEGNRIDNILETGVPSKIKAAIIRHSAEQGGVKNGAQVNHTLGFEDLADPGLFIRQTRSVAGTAAGTHNKNIGRLCEIAVKTQDAGMAAALIKEAGSGVGVDDKTISAILNEKTPEHFISRVADSYKKMTGKSLDNFIRGQYSKIGIDGIGIFGANKKGNNYLAVIDKARNNTHGITPSSLVMASVSAF